jgi:hypothetical protein
MRCEKTARRLPLVLQGHQAGFWSEAMKNPWTKKNPFMSMWLSGANAVIGSARSRATAASKRQANALITESTRQMLDLWTSALPTSPKPKRKR